MKRVKNLASLAQRFHKQCLRCHYMGEGLLTTNLLPLSAALQAGAKAGERVSRGVKYAIMTLQRSRGQRSSDVIKQHHEGQSL